MARLLIALIAMLLVPAVVRAQTPALACPPADGAGKMIQLKAPLDEPTRLGLGYALMIGITSDDRNWPHPQLSAQKACAIGNFKALDVELTLNGGGDPALPRWAQANSGGEIAFLARTPTIPEGYAFSQATQKPMMMALGSPMYALVIERQNMRYITQVYDSVPPTRELIADMAASLQGGRPPIAALDPDSGALSFIIGTQSDRRAIIPGLLPGEGGKPARLQAPDGDMFIQAPGGGVRMARSKFLCPPSTMRFGLKDLWVGNATEDARDLSCSFVGDKGRISVSVARHANGPSTKSVYDDNLEAVKKNSGVAGVSRPPVGAGEPPLPRFAAAWTDKDDQRQGFWLAAIDDWYVEVLASYSAQASSDIGKAVGQIYKDAFREVGGR